MLANLTYRGACVAELFMLLTILFALVKSVHRNQYCLFQGLPCLHFPKVLCTWHGSKEAKSLVLTRPRRQAHSPAWDNGKKKTAIISLIFFFESLLKAVYLSHPQPPPLFTPALGSRLFSANFAPCLAAKQRNHALRLVNCRCQRGKRQCLPSLYHRGAASSPSSSQSSGHPSLSYPAQGQPGEASRIRAPGIPPTRGASSPVLNIPVGRKVLFLGPKELIC